MSLLRVLIEAQVCTCFLILNPTVTPLLLLPACTCQWRQACASVRARKAARISDNRISSFVSKERIVIVIDASIVSTWIAACRLCLDGFWLLNLPCSRTCAWKVALMIFQTMLINAAREISGCVALYDEVGNGHGCRGRSMVV